MFLSFIRSAKNYFDQGVNFKLLTPKVAELLTNLGKPGLNYYV